MSKALGVAARKGLRLQFDDKRLLQFELRDTHEKSGAEPTFRPKGKSIVIERARSSGKSLPKSLEAITNVV